jgi:hypothetical protein
MLQPQALSRAYIKCVSDYAGAGNCQSVMRAQADFVALVDERTANAEHFGQKIIQAQIRSAQLYRQYQQLCQRYKESKVKLLPEQTSLSVASLALTKALTTYNLSKEQISILLAVVAETSAI